MNPTTIDVLIVLAAVIVGVLASARVTRLIVADSFPPSVWLRMKFAALTKDGSWSVLAQCPWCLAPYVVAADLWWALGVDIAPMDTGTKIWWIVNGWLAAAYVASWIVYHDED